MAPPRVKAGDKQISATFLNYCRDGIATFATLGLGVEEAGKHQDVRLWLEKCQFLAETPVEIPAYSIFGIEDDPDETETLNRAPVASAVQITSNYIGALYTNGSQTRGDEDYFNPYSISPKTVYRLTVDPTNPPAVGDYCSPKPDTWLIEKGGVKLLCLTTPDADNEAWFTGIPTGVAGEQRIGYVKGNNIEARSLGLVELYDKDDIPNGTEVTVYNPHDVVFYKENTDPGDEAPADRVMLFVAEGWDEPVIFPFMLSPCQQIDPTFEPIDV